MEGIRIIKLPPAKMASSGDKGLDKFNFWWSQVDKERKDKFFPRDFMWYDPGKKSLVWYYALPSDLVDAGGFDIADFPGGLYAAAISRNQDDTDGERVYAAIKEWVENSGVFAMDERAGHYTMFHIITPDEVFKAIGYRQLDLFVPIKLV